MAISSSGIGSGIDIESLVSQLVAAEGQPATLRLNKQEAVFQADLSAVGLLKAALSEFQTAVKGLADKTAFQERTATTETDSPFEITAGTTAVSGSYDIEVVALAKAAKVRSAGFTAETDTIGTGTLDISLGASSFSITIDDTNKSLAGIRDAINKDESNPGITASIINVDGGHQLVLSSNQEGAENTIDIVATDNDGADGFDLTQLSTANLTTIQAAQDAQMKVDGQMVTRNRNRFSDVITGITFDLKKVSTDGEASNFKVELNDGSVKSKVFEFVAAFNDLSKVMDGLGSYDPNTKVAGQLQGDPGLRAIKNQIRQVMSSPIGESGLTYTSLASIGIKTSEAGVLENDLTKLDEVISADADAIANLFASDNGLATTLDTILSGFLKTDGMLGSRTTALEGRIKALADDRGNLERRLTSIEARLRKQFGAMDSLVANLNSTSSFLAQQLENLPGPRILK